MALKGIINCEYSRILKKIAVLPDEEATGLNQELATVYELYQQQLQQLAATIEKYDRIVARVSRRQAAKKLATNVSVRDNLIIAL
ncbi:MAG TPA: hypothetical protein VK671_05520 [Mucilaginibacter sp.]|jgi:hypothetical protein|nr:hypothetical protein [Mucilaginibacter sp.]